MRQIEEIFSFGKLQGFLTLLKELETRGLSVEDLRSYVAARRKEMDEATRGTKFDGKPCPECGTNMTLMPLNTGTRDQTGDDSKSVWYCPTCHFEEFSEKTVDSIIKEEIAK